MTGLRTGNCQPSPAPTRMAPKADLFSAAQDRRRWEAYLWAAPWNLPTSGWQAPGPLLPPDTAVQLAGVSEKCLPGTLTPQGTEERVGGRGPTSWGGDGQCQALT